jgi:hypothetical protein
LKAKFHEDNDSWGKQDPFVQFRYNGRLLKTSTKSDAGKKATWNEDFTLDNIHSEIRSGGKLRLEALDDDTMSDDWIGATMPLAFSELVHSSERVERKLYFVDKSGKEIGNVKISTQYIADRDGHNSRVISSPHRQSYVSDSRHHVDGARYVSDSTHHSSPRVVRSSGHQLTDQYIRPHLQQRV